MASKIVCNLDRQVLGTSLSFIMRFSICEIMHLSAQASFWILLWSMSNVHPPECPGNHANLFDLLPLGAVEQQAQRSNIGRQLTPSRCPLEVRIAVLYDCVLLHGRHWQLLQALGHNCLWQRDCSPFPHPCVLEHKLAMDSNILNIMLQQ